MAIWGFSGSTSEDEDSYTSMPGGRLADNTSGASLSLSEPDSAFSAVDCTSPRGSVGGGGRAGSCSCSWAALAGAPRKPRPPPRPRPRPPRPPPLPRPAGSGSLGRFIPVDMRCSGSSPPLDMASSTLRFFSAIRAVVGQRRLRSSIHASMASGVSSFMLVPWMRTGRLGSGLDNSHQLSALRHVPFQTRVCVPIGLPWAMVPARWIYEMSVHHVYL